ncbi:Gfo/Idh/MocA family protein [Sphingopyxis sp. P8]|uniref:Gfo/Idh/MocA family protein n=1 Tax=Sphingopyxis sp. P8 TaxID=2763256 RepID=UPI001D0A03F6|nr:Gfo/Idh/MocA family oxidoreductase [Sphingopyxis sp. P8]
MTGVAFIGAGTVASLYGQAFEAGVNARFCGAFDRDPGAAALMAEHLGGRAYAGVEELLADPAVDAVIVMTPIETHYAIAMQALSAGKHVLLEKPVATTVSEIDALDQAARSRGLVCMPAHNYIYNSTLQRAHRLARDGKLGNIASFWMLYNIAHSPDVARRYGGVLRAVGIHPIYTMLYLVGRPVRVKAAASRLASRGLPFEDQAMITCELPGGALANLWVSFAASDVARDPWTMTCKLIGDGGAASFSWNDTLCSDEGGPAWGIPEYVESFAAELEHFVGVCIARGAPPLSTLADARTAQRIIEAAERSIANDGRFEFVDADGDDPS